jgi:hypothetical protein
LAFRTGAKAPIDARRARQKKIDNFLQNRPASGIVFQKGSDKSGWRLPWRPCDQGRGGQRYGSDRKWRRKPLKSLETDSQNVIRRFAVARSGESIRRTL